MEDPNAKIPLYVPDMQDVTDYKDLIKSLLSALKETTSEHHYMAMCEHCERAGRKFIQQPALRSIDEYSQKFEAIQKRNAKLKTYLSEAEIERRIGYNKSIGC